jgi:nucleoside-diphosphate-sugar epimerase
MREIILTGHTSKLSNDIEKTINNFRFIKHDIRNQHFNYHKNIDIILNFAALNPMSQDKNNYFVENQKIANTIVDLALKVRAKKIINISAMSMFNGIKSNIVSQLTEPAPIDEYSMSKYQMEKIFNNSGVNSVVNIRIPGVVNIHKNNTLFDRFRAAISNNLEIIFYNGEKLTNNVINISNLHGFISATLSSNLNANVNYNLGANNPLKIIEVIKLMKKKYKSTSKLTECVSSKNAFHIDLTEELKIYQLSNTYEYI